MKLTEMIGDKNLSVRCYRKESDLTKSRNEVAVDIFTLLHDIDGFIEYEKMYGTGTTQYDFWQYMGDIRAALMDALPFVAEEKK